MHEISHFARCVMDRSQRGKPPMTRQPLTRFAWLSIGAAIATIALKGLAWQLTGSVGAYNESRLIGKTITTMPDFVGHIIVINDCSTDDTSEQARAVGDAGARHRPRPQHRRRRLHHRRP
jgi:hypothetical protein